MGNQFSVEDALKKWRDTGESFFKIERWRDDDSYIILSLHIGAYGNPQLFLNRRREKTGYLPEGGVEIPREDAQEIARWILRQTTSKAYVKGTCKKNEIGKKGEYTFETIQSFPLRDGRVIKLCLMYNKSETKLFLNRSDDKPEKGVEFSFNLAGLIATALSKYAIK